MRSLELIGTSSLSGGFNCCDAILTADITPSTLALNLYIRTQGSNSSPEEYFKTKTPNTRKEAKVLPIDVKQEE